MPLDKLGCNGMEDKRIQELSPLALEVLESLEYYNNEAVTPGWNIQECFEMNIRLAQKVAKIEKNYNFLLESL